jgi:fibro-slime domain-containing protein
MTKLVRNTDCGLGGLNRTRCALLRPALRQARDLTTSIACLVLAGCASVEDSRSPSAPSTGGGLVAPEDPEPHPLPEGFTRADRGGWRLGAEIEGGPGTPGDGGASGQGGANGNAPIPCETTLFAVVRDFRRGDQAGLGHPDFQTFAGAAPSPGIVASALGPDQRPAHVGAAPHVGAQGQQTSGSARFEEWYRTLPGTNRAFSLELAFEPSEGRLVFESTAFFPLDDQGFGNESLAHNYHFTTELHTEFVYRPGDRFTFSGDDDLWVYINGHLVIDLGGLHPPLSATVELDVVAESLGLEPQQVYPLDLFHAERRAVYSNFHVETSLRFTNCYTLEPVVR